MSVTIPKDTLDPYYRYKRDLICVVHIAKHGGQTKITNLEKVAEQIDRPVKELKKYIQKKMCLAIKGDFLPGKRTPAEIDDIIEKYIIKYVLCKHCGNPETDRERRCKACGNKS